MADVDQENVVPINPDAAPDERVGYARPPVHSRFKPGQSGNPSGRTKGNKNLKTLFRKILNEEISLREGAVQRTVSKGEAIIRGLVVSALKGDAKSIGTLFRLAEQTGELAEEKQAITAVTRIIVNTGVPRAVDESALPASSEVCRDRP